MTVIFTNPEDVAAIRVQEDALKVFLSLHGIPEPLDCPFCGHRMEPSGWSDFKECSNCGSTGPSLLHASERAQRQAFGLLDGYSLCPYCKGKDVGYEFSSSTWYVACRTCGCDGPTPDEGSDPLCEVEPVIEAWNHRASS